MRYFWKLVLALMPIFLVSVAGGQRLNDKLATSTNATFTAASLSPPAQKVYLDQRKLFSEGRSELFSIMVANAVLELESKTLNSTREKLLASARAKVPEPTAAEIQKVYNANTAQLGGRSLAEVREDIVEFLKHEGEQKVVNDYLQALRIKHKVTMGKDVNAVGLGPADVLVTVGPRNITLREFEDANKVALNDAQIEVFEGIRSDLEASIFSALAAEEAKTRNMDIGAFIGAEITDKLRLFSDGERAEVEAALMRRLFTKYNVKILLPEPTPIVHNVLIESDDPQMGNTSAPVTVVMFTDFQCPACSRTHPILKQTLAGYGDKIRFVVRDFPLESIHADAFQAALAANAARAQGKFFEYAEILYRNQEALDKPSLFKYAAELGLNAKQFELDFSDARAQAEVKKDQSDARSHGVNSTPAIFVNGVKVQRLSAEAFRRAVDRALSK